MPCSNLSQWEKKLILNTVEWTSKPMWPIAVRVTTRTSNRILFGRKLAANKEFLKLSIDYTYTVFGGAHAIREYPGVLKPLIMRLKTNIVNERALAKKHLSPLFKERIRSMQEVVKTGCKAVYESTKPDDAGDSRPAFLSLYENGQLTMLCSPSSPVAS